MTADNGAASASQPAANRREGSTRTTGTTAATARPHGTNRPTAAPSAPAPGTTGTTGERPTARRNAKNNAAPAKRARTQLPRTASSLTLFELLASASLAGAFGVRPAAEAHGWDVWQYGDNRMLAGGRPATARATEDARPIPARCVAGFVTSWLTVVRCHRRSFAPRSPSARTHSRSIPAPPSIATPRFHSDSTELVVLPGHRHRQTGTPRFRPAPGSLHRLRRRTAAESGALQQRGHPGHRRPRSSTTAEAWAPSSAKSSPARWPSPRSATRTTSCSRSTFNDDVTDANPGRRLSADDVPSSSASLSAMVPEGRTALYDALIAGLDRMEHAQRGQARADPASATAATTPAARRSTRCSRAHAPPTSPSTRSASSTGRRRFQSRRAEGASRGRRAASASCRARPARC